MFFHKERSRNPGMTATPRVVSTSQGRGEVQKWRKNLQSFLDGEIFGLSEEVAADIWLRQYKPDALTGASGLYGGKLRLRTLAPLYFGSDQLFVTTAALPDRKQTTFPVTCTECEPSANELTKGDECHI